MTPHMNTTLSILSAISFLCSNTQGELTMPHSIAATAANTQSSAILLPCGKMPDGTELKHAIIGNKLYITDGTTLHRFTIFNDSLVLWDSDEYMYTDEEHEPCFTESPAAASGARDIIQISGKNVYILRNGITYKCTFIEPQRGLSRKNRIPKEVWEASQKRRNRAEAVLKIYSESVVE